MKETQPKLHEWFHKFMIYFALWVFPLIGIIEGIWYINYADENNAENKIIIIILSALLILLTLTREHGAYGIRWRKLAIDRDSLKGILRDTIDRDQQTIDAYKAWLVANPNPDAINEQKDV